MRVPRALAFVMAAAAIAGVVDGPVPRAETLRSGFDVNDFDRRVRATHDLYRHVHGGAADRTSMPPDRVTYGTVAELSDKTERDLREIIEEISARPDRP